ncbi:glycosyltransferase [uncultured Microbacterium sp.]|uniref:glycosyltransferase n=1 Tax=uncultured Microbacterium sp. TaxID=191216 RepID=UPI0025D0F28F|nr:glycosyltransferase [uncultured Microbacterium sp.]
MKVIVYPHDLGIGGSQLNAIELAAGVRDLGHEVLVFGRPGALNGRIDQLGLEFVEAPPPGRRPSPTTARALVDLVRARGVDVIHGYEWPPVLDAVLAAALGSPARVVGTVMSMSVPPFIPHDVELVVGTEQIAAVERRAGRPRVRTIEPPVDLAFNDPALPVGVDAFRMRYGLDDGRVNVVSVTRFARELKLEGTLAAIDVVGRISDRFPVRLVLVGDGPARDEVAERARRVNERHGEGTVVLTGRLDDPRPAYAVADVALGMGGSALRSLAFGKPLIVQGESGFWRTLTSETVDRFSWTGWYGVGEGEQGGADALEAELAPLLAAPSLRAVLGEYGLELARSRFSLTRASAVQLQVYREALAEGSQRQVGAEIAALARYAGYYARKRISRVLGRESLDDFNARPVAARRDAERVPS